MKNVFLFFVMIVVCNVSSAGSCDLLISDSKIGEDKLISEEGLEILRQKGFTIISENPGGIDFYMLSTQKSCQSGFLGLFESCKYSANAHRALADSISFPLPVDSMGEALTGVRDCYN